MNLEALHSTYVASSKLAVSWSMARLYTWEFWIAFRTPPFSVADLKLVIRHIQTGIKDGKRNSGALKFSNLIGNPERFEEDLAEAMALSRRPVVDQNRASVLRATGRPGETDQTGTKKAVELTIVQALTDPDKAAQAFAEFQKMKGNL